MVNFSGNTVYRRVSRISWAAIFFLLSCSLVFGVTNFQVSLDRNTISLGETANLSVTFTDGAGTDAPNLPAIPNLTIKYRGQSSQVQVINAAVSSSVTHSFEVAPAKVGDFVIPAMRVQLNGKVFSSQPLTLKVVQGTAPATAEKLPAFIKLIVPKTQVYVGEPLPVEIQLYVQEARDLNMPQLNSEGFTVGNIPQPTQTRTRMGGEIYYLVIFKAPVTATRSGSLTIGPATLNLKLLMGPRDFFGRFTQDRPVTLKSEPQPVQVLPLPKVNQPANFNGAIGNFTMQFSAGPTNLAVGDPITLKVQISGRGSLDMLAMPPQTEWREFKSYPATSKIDSNDPLGLEGLKTFEQVVVPQNSAIKELPEFAFSFFDPEQKAYRTLSHPAIQLTVRPTAATPPPTIFSNNVEGTGETPSREIVHIKPQLGMIHASSVPLMQKPWFWVLQSFPPLLWLGALIYRRQKENLANNPKLRRQRAVEKIVGEELRKLKPQADANQSDEFFATVFRLLQEQIGERLDLPASSITEAVVDESLKPRGLDSETAALLHELFQTCNQARYAPIRSSQQLASYIPKVEAAIFQLEKFKR